MRYKNKHFYTVAQQVEFMLYEEKLSENDIFNVVSTDWGSKDASITLYINEARQKHQDTTQIEKRNDSNLKNADKENLFNL